MRTCTVYEHVNAERSGSRSNAERGNEENISP